MLSENQLACSYLTHNNRLINLNYPCKSKLSAQVLMYLEHLINKVLAITLTHLFTSSQFSFSKRVFPCGARVEGGGGPGPLGRLPAAVGTAHLHGALQSCLALPVPSFL